MKDFFARLFFVRLRLSGFLLNVKRLASLPKKSLSRPIKRKLKKHKQRNTAAWKNECILWPLNSRDQPLPPRHIIFRPRHRQRTTPFCTNRCHPLERNINNIHFRNTNAKTRHQADFRSLGGNDTRPRCLYGGFACTRSLARREPSLLKGAFHKT